jgi:hypothetical protein
MISLFEKAEKLITDVLFPEFVQKRLESAKKFFALFKERGKFSTLSAWHFGAKIKPYLMAKRWSKKPAKEREHLFKERYKRAYLRLKNLDKLSQKDFQSVSGVLETYGELYLQSKKPKDYNKE